MPRTNSGLDVNRAKLAETFGVSVDTVSAWVKRGCPVVEKGSKGKPWVFNTKAIFEWHLGSSLADEKARPETYEKSKARKMQIDAELAEIDLDLKRGTVVEVFEIAQLVRDEYATIRGRFLSLPGELAHELDATRAVEFQPVIAEAIDEILAELTQDDSLASGETDSTGDPAGGEAGDAPARSAA